jgi:hypothetical protein
MSGLHLHRLPTHAAAAQGQSALSRFHFSVIATISDASQ